MISRHHFSPLRDSHVGHFARMQWRARERVVSHNSVAKKSWPERPVVIPHRDYRARRVSVRDVTRGKSRGMTSSSLPLLLFFSSFQSFLKIRTCAGLSPNTRFLTSGPPRRARSLVATVILLRSKRKNEAEREREGKRD